MFFIPKKYYPDTLKLHEVFAEILIRITSYNVCYTKLLRLIHLNTNIHLLSYHLATNNISLDDTSVN